MPTVYADDINGHIADFIARPITPIDSGISTSRPTTPLKPCLKTHARAHSAARKRRVTISEKNNTVQEHSTSAKSTGQGKELVHTHSSSLSQEAMDPPRPAVHHNENADVSSMFGMSMSNPNYQPDPEKRSHHYTPFNAPPQKIADTIQLKLDNRMISLHEAFRFLDMTNSGYITQEELLNACLYWGIHLEPKDFAMLAEEYQPVCLCRS